MTDRSLSNAHLKKAIDDLREAQSLLDAGFTDGTCNRAYYALFHAVLAMLHTTDASVPKTHTGAHTEFRRQFIRTGLISETLSTTITTLFNLRQGSDYEIGFDISLDDAQDAVEQASSFLTTVQVYLRASEAH
ncbi:hypothetical protein GCM10027578_07400 [Spirosoma luteolum]|jgi:uncharacterized protein (UPF0332 family)